MITSAPMSASIIPQVGPAMICASSRTRMPASGPGACWCPLASSTSAPDEFRLSLGQKRRVADAEVFGVEAGEAFVVLGRGDRPRVRQAARELLVPARDERRAFGDALRGRERFGRHLGIRRRRA